MIQLASHFWRLSLGNSYTLVKPMFARDTSKGTGSRARGEGRERGNLIDLIETIPKPLGSPEDPTSPLGYQVV